MAGWYVRRGEKVVGPVELPKLKELAAAGRIVPTDLLAKDVAGPWTKAGKTTLFAKPSSKPLPVPAVPPDPPATTIVRVKQSPQDADSPNKGLAVLRGGLSAISSIGRGAMATGSTVGRKLSQRSQRKNELRSAKIQADLAEAWRRNRKSSGEKT